VTGAGRTVMVERRQERAVLAVLALRAGEVVSTSVLIDALWGEEMPASADTSLRAVVSRLRRLVAPTGVDVDHRGHGYVLLADPDDVDALRFERSVADAARVEDASERARRLADALDLWGGQLLAGDAAAHGGGFLAGAAQHLDAIHAGAVEARLRAELDAGGKGDPAALEALLREHPYREGAWAALMIALYRHGRQADALAAYQRARDLLVEDLGVEPGPELQTTERAVLNHDGGVLLAARARWRARPPAPVTDLVGRQDELHGAVAALDRSRLVTLTGLGGIGKTRVAVETARLLEGSGVRVAWVGLADVDATRVAGAVRDGTGSTAPGWHLDVDVLVVDNCEHVADAVSPLLVHVLADNAGLRVLSTSREPLGVPGEAVRPIGPLAWTGARPGAPSDALELLWQRARAANPALVLDDDARTQLTRICEAVDGVPLALELAGGRLATTDVASLADDLTSGRAADRPGRRRGAARHATMAAALDSSYSHLAQASRDALAELAVFRGGFTRDAAVSVCAAGPAVLDALDELVMRSWVTFSPNRGGRYRLLEPVRQYAAGRAGPADRQVAERHAAWAARFAEEAGRGIRADQRAWSCRIDDERANLAAAVDWSLRRDGDTCALRILAALGVAWSQQGGPDPLAWAAPALEQGRNAPDRLRAKALVAAGAVARNSWDRTRAAAWIDEAIDVYRQSGKGSGLAYAVLERAMCAMLDTEQDYGEAWGLFDEALDLFRALGDALGIGWCLMNLGFIRICEGDDDAAVPYLERALEVAEAAGIPHVVGAAERDLGRIAYRRGDRTTGWSMMSRAIEVYRQQGDRWQLGNALGAAAMTVLVDDAPAAAGLLAETLVLGEETGLPDHILHAALGVARLADELGLSAATIEVGCLVVGPARQARVRLPGTDDWLGVLARMTRGLQRPATLEEIARAAWRGLAEVRVRLDGAQARDAG
jgi:predicted ATPase/DNA-binding SARP family transcriptional activator